MSTPTLTDYAERELKYQVRREVSKRIRNNCHETDPMVTGIIVMLGSILTMAAFSEIIGARGRGR